MNQDYQKEVTAYAKRIFKTEDGKKLMEYLELFYYNTASFDPNNSHKTAFNEGGRDVVADLKERINAK